VGSAGIVKAMLVDELLPLYEISDAVATDVEADRAATYAALLEVDLVEVGRRKPLIGFLGALRALPDVAIQLMHGERPPQAPDRMRLHDLADMHTSEGGWILLGERENEEIALGLVGKFWKPVIEFADVSAAEFKEFSEPGFAKHVYSLSLSELVPGRTLLRAEMRVATTDEHARKWFRRYWTFGVGSGAHVLITGFIEDARDRAEASSTT
jgi:hypothetical protein